MERSMAGEAPANAERLHHLVQCAPDTPMGKLLRQFWHPIALAGRLKPGSSRGLRALGEDLTLYRGQSEKHYLVAGRCAHRRTFLHTGWVQGEEIRCVYHGWKYDGTGQCTEAPAEGAATAAKIKIAAYPLREYAGMLFAYMGKGEPPNFDLQRKPEFESDDYIVLAREQIWPCNWFQQVENSLDAVHVSFVHHAGIVGSFGEAISQDIPKLEYFETESGIRQIATRSPTNVRVSDWTFPNFNHIITPGRTRDEPWVHRGVWNVPLDDTHTRKYGVFAIPKQNPDDDCEMLEYCNRHLDYSPAEHHEALFERREFPTEPLIELTPAQDYFAIMGQGEIADRVNERLGKSDAGIVLLRRIFWREMDLIAQSRPTKVWRKLEQPAELPKPVHETAIA